METLRKVNKSAEEIMAAGQIPVLDKGYIRLVDYMGTDETVVAAARQSYDQATDVDAVAKNTKLINFLMKNSHTSPFEQPSMVFEVKAPIFVFREWHRHRLARLNEMSGRYTELPEEFYIPALSRIQTQSSTNKQGSAEPLGRVDANYFVMDLEKTCKAAFANYHTALKVGVARELARLCLPVNTYSKMVWQADLRNILGFLKLRAAASAQWEIRQYAIAMSNMVSFSFPKVWEAFIEFNMDAISFSASEAESLREYFISDSSNPQNTEEIKARIAAKFSV